MSTDLKGVIARLVAAKERLNWLKNQTSAVELDLQRAISDLADLTVPEDLKEKAWQIYCQDSAGGMDVVDDWNQLGRNTQARFLALAIAHSS